MFCLVGATLILKYIHIQDKAKTTADVLFYRETINIES